MPSRIARASLIFAFVSAAGIWACSEAPVENTPPPSPRATTITVISGDDQNGVVGQLLGADVVVRLDDQNGSPMAGQGITFAVVSGGGSLGATSATTDGSGLAATSWTLGTAAGAQQIRAASSSNASVQTLVDATASADAADSVAVLSGDDQVGIINQPLFDSVVVKVFDQYGNGVPDHPVSFAAGAGGTGSADPAATTTAANGEAWTRWTLGPEVAVQTLDVNAGGLKSEPLAFSAQGTNLTVTLISPDPLVEGQAAATITGTGFSTTPADNVVMVGDSPATVTASDATTITFTVPTFDCQPAQDRSVQVFVNGLPSIAQDHAVRPADFVSLAVGEQLLVQDPADFCFQFDADAGSKGYLIGVQAVGEVMGRLTATQVTAAKDPAAPAPPATLPSLLSVPSVGGVDPLTSSPRARRWAAHRADEAELRSMERRIVPRPPQGRFAAAAAAGGPRRVPPTVSVGDTLPFKFPDRNGNFCTESIAITTVVRAKGTRGIWLEDVANPTPGYTLADFQSLSDQLDTLIYDAHTAYFGAPTDLDANGRIAVVVSVEVQNYSTNTLGFVVSTDTAPISVCPASNEAEVYYAKAPDTSYPVSEAILDAPFLIAHEFTHITQFGRRNVSPSAVTYQSRWEGEGQATLAEEVIGYAYEGKSSWQNYGLDVVLNQDDNSDVDWFGNAFTDLGVYFGWLGGSSKTDLAPHECTWLGSSNDGEIGPCLASRNPYGTPWSLLRWLSDHLGSTFPGGEGGVHRAIIDGDVDGFDNLEAELGVDMNEVLAKWAATLYVDGRIAVADSTLSLPSWHLYDIFFGVAGGFRLRPELRLEPATATFGDFTRSASVRDASNYYLLVSGGPRPSVAIKARTPAGAALPSFMQYWIVRTQ
ncbi:MAG: IPT/TIG domain-containing protein [Gemmatimonadota bacterium]|nr:MAG: IPT/TIG domain-containing protein [Gemmatimonadota bacterium]